MTCCKVSLPTCHINVSMLCTSKIHPFSFGNYWGPSLIIGSLMRIRVTSVEWTRLRLEWPLA